MRKPIVSPFSVKIALAAFIIIFSDSSSVLSDQLNGRVQLGGSGNVQPQKNVLVTLYEATEGQPIVIGRDRTNPGGRFRISTNNDHSESVFFVTADLCNGVQFVAILGPELPPEIIVNELTSVAASYSMAQFYRKGYISGNSFGLRIAAMMNNNIVKVRTGKSSNVLLSSPNADETHSLRMTRSLANLLNSSAQNFFIRLLFLHATTPSGGSMPQNTAVSMANLARNPGNLAFWLYLLSQTSTTYSPPLFQRPDAWTVTVKVNDSGDSRLFGGPGNVAFDSRGYAWCANNSVQGTPFSGNFNIVLKPDGTPADGGPGLPTSPISGGGALGAGWGVTVDRTDTVWFGNFGWGGEAYFPTTNPPGSGSVTKFSSAGTALSLPDGFYGGTYRVQAIKVDEMGNVWCSSFGNDKVVVFPNGDPLQAIESDFYNSAGPFGLAISPDGCAWVSNSGGLSGLAQSSVAKLRLHPNGELIPELVINVGDTLKVIDVDSLGNAWVASQGDSRIYGFAPDGRSLGGYKMDGSPKGFRGGGVYGPWGLCIDGEDNIWIGNFGPLEVGSNFTDGGVSKICGANPTTWPPGKMTGDPISPRSRYTVQSAGDQVLLNDGTPLYSKGQEGQDEISYSPIMRTTSVQIDQAGNLWNINNWKPRFNTDIGLFDTGELVDDVDPDAGNPGGDGIIIFVGLAPPRPNPNSE